MYEYANSHLEWLQGAAFYWLTLLADASVKGFALLLLTGGITLAMRKASAAARQMVWVLALASLLALPILSATLPAWQVLPNWLRVEVTTPPVPGNSLENVASRSGPPPEIPADKPPDQVDASVTDHAGPSPVKAAAAPPPPQASYPKEPLKQESPGRQVLPWVLPVWAAGVLVSLMPLVLGRLSLRRLERSAQRIASGTWMSLLRRATCQLELTSPVVLLESPRRAMPMVWGLWKCRLLLPAEATAWSADRRYVVLLHELAHAKRHDCLAKLVAHLAAAIYWFNPLVWVAAKRMQIEAEAACDDLVLAGGQRASDYAECLLEIASGLRAGMLAAYSSIAMARPSRLENRLLAILDDHRNRRRLTAAGVALAVLLLAGIVLPLSVLHAAASGSKQAKEITQTVEPTTQPVSSGNVTVLSGRGFRMTKTTTTTGQVVLEAPVFKVSIRTDPKGATRPASELKYNLVSEFPVSNSGVTVIRISDKGNLNTGWTGPPKGELEFQGFSLMVNETNREAPGRPLGMLVAKDGKHVPVASLMQGDLAAWVRQVARDRVSQPYVAVLLPDADLGTVEKAWRAVPADARDRWILLVPGKIPDEPRLVKLAAESKTPATQPTFIPKADQDGLCGEITLTLGWNGQKIIIPGPIVWPEEARKMAEFRRWQAMHDVRTLSFTDSAGRRWQAKTLAQHMPEITIHRPDGTLLATGMVMEDSGPSHWEFFDASGKKQVLSVICRAEKNEKGDLTGHWSIAEARLYGSEGTERAWELYPSGLADVVRGEMVTLPGGHSYYAAYAEPYNVPSKRYTPELHDAAKASNVRVVSDTMIANAQAGNQDVVKRLVMPDSPLAKRLADLPAMLKGGQFSVPLDSVSIQGNQAQAAARRKKGGVTESVTLHLVQSNDYWLVADMESLNENAATQPTATLPSLSEHHQDDYDIYIVGSVQRPGIYSVPRDRQPWTLMNLLGVAGVQTDKKLSAQVLRTTSEGVNQQFAVDVFDLFAGSVANPPLLENDLVLVGPADQWNPTVQKNPSSAAVMINGEVQRPGDYSVPGAKVALSRMLAGAGFDLAKVRQTRITVLRRKDGNEQTPISVELSGVLSGTVPDFEIVPGDVIAVTFAPLPTTTQGSPATQPAAAAAR